MKSRQIGKKMDQCSSDKVDILLEQWRNQRPDLDFKAMGTIGRIKRCTLLLQKKSSLNYQN